MQFLEFLKQFYHKMNMLFFFKKVLTVLERALNIIIWNRKCSTPLKRNFKLPIDFSFDHSKQLQIRDNSC